MTPKASTKTTISLGVIEAPVSLYKTIDAKASVAPRFVSEPVPASNDLSEASTTSAPLDPLSEAPEIPAAGYSRKAVAEVKRRRGVLKDGEFIDLTDHLDALDEQYKLDAMTIISFIRREQVPRERIVGSYWLAPDTVQSARVLRLISEGMRNVGRVAVAKWSKSKNQALGIIVPHRSGALLVLELEFASRARLAENNPKVMLTTEVEVTDEQIAAATSLVEKMADYPVAIDEVTDDRITALTELHEAAMEGNLGAVVTADEVIQPWDELIDSLNGILEGIESKPQ